MKVLASICAISINLLLAGSAHAGMDPVSWSISPTGGLPAQSQVGNTYVVTYTLKNNLPTALPITIKRIFAANTVTIDDSCDNKSLSANGTCVIHVGVQPVQIGLHKVTIQVNYGNNQVPLPALSTTAVSGATAQGISGFITQPLPPNVVVGNAYPVAFKFYNDGAASVTATSITPTGFTPSSNTCTVALASNASCLVQGTYTPAAAGQVALTVAYNYTLGGAKTYASTANANAATTVGCNQVAAQSVLPLPTWTYLFSDSVTKFTFTNSCSAGSQVLGTVSLSAELDGVVKNDFLTKGTVAGVNDTCSGATLAAGASCSVYVSTIPTTAGAALSVAASVTYNGGAITSEAASTEQVRTIPNQDKFHSLIFVNQCDYPVWYEFLNGNGKKANNGIFSPDPTPGRARTPDDYKLVGHAGSAPFSKLLNVPRYENGKINARTGCDANMVCKTASCEVVAGTGTCKTSVGAGMPSTAFESFMTNVPNTDGVYNLSLINGFNVPVEIKGLAPVSLSDPFSCTAAGAPIQPATTFATPLGACSWTFTPPNQTSTVPNDSTRNYVFTSAGADDACTTTAASCTGTDVCGTAWASNINTGAGTPINRRCGAFQGYWTVTDYIGFKLGGQWGPTNLYTHYQINTALPAAYGNSTVNAGAATNYDMYGCKPTSNNSLNTGYNSGLKRVCGCYDWDKTGSPAKTNISAPCKINTDAPNPLWLSTVFDRISWLKAACPTAYSYQFDDKASSFTCNQAGRFTSYQIVFCPGGKTGAPA